MNHNATLDDMIIQYSENPFVDEMQYKAFTTYDRIKKTTILNKLLYMSNLVSQNKMEEMRQTFRSIQPGI